MVAVASATLITALGVNHVGPLAFACRVAASSRGSKGETVSLLRVRRRLGASLTRSRQKRLVLVLVLGVVEASRADVRGPPLPYRHNDVGELGDVRRRGVTRHEDIIVVELMVCGPYHPTDRILTTYRYVAATASKKMTHICDLDDIDHVTPRKRDFVLPARCPLISFVWSVPPGFVFCICIDNPGIQ